MNILLLVCPPYSEIEKLLRLVERLRTALNAGITALCVRSEIAQKYYSPFSIQLGKVDKEGEKRVFEEITRVLGKGVTKLSRGGEPVSQVLEEVEKGGYGMLVYADVDRSMTKKIAEHSLIPTLIYRGGEDIRSILICVDGSEHALKACRFAGKLAQGLEGVRVTVLSIASTDEEVENARRAVGEANRELAKVFRGEVESRVERGRVEERIIEESEKYSLVVLAPRGLSKLHRLVMGHVSLHVVERARTNVLLVR